MSAFASLMKPVGPKAEAFAWDKRLITGIMGPVGSAKTTTCIRKYIHAAMWQNPGPDGVRRARIGVIRDTYPLLRKTVLQSWFGWFPKDLGHWNGESPFQHNLRILVPGLGYVELEVLFAAMGEARAEDVMRGWELTALHLNEGDLLAKAVFSFGMGRIGRYPDMKLGGCTWRGIFIDMNAPDVENWTYEILVDQNLGLDPEQEKELRAQLGELFGVGFYVQPGGRSKDPLPENIHNLPKGYYAQQMLGQSKDYIRRMVDNEFGAVRKGQPVYPEYQDEVHCAKEKLAPIKDKPLRLSVDGGLTPAAVLQQRDHRGQIRTLGEVVVFADNDDTELEQLGPTAFGQRVARYVQDEFPDNPIAEIAYSDPAASAGEAAGGEDRSWRQAFQKALSEALGYRIRVKSAPVKGNALTPRLEAVRKPMLRLVEGAEPAFIICPVRCKILRRGFKGMYVYRRSQLQGGHGRFVDEPVKNDYSHVQDACQYGCASYETSSSDGMIPHTGHPGQARRGRQVKNDRTYNVFGGG
jgi:hypothetical protein